MEGLENVSVAEYSISSDDEVSFSTSSDDGQNLKSDYCDSPVSSEDEPKKDGLSLLLEAMMQCSGQYEHSSGRTSVLVNNSSDVKVKRSASNNSPLSDVERWSILYDALVAFGKKNGHCNVPNSFECQGRNGMNIKLGTWLSTQRQLKKKGALRPEREVKLQRLVDEGLLQWSMPSIASPDEDKWSAMLEALVKYGDAHGHCNVPYSCDSTIRDGSVVKLGAWLRKQREHKKKGTLRPDREQKLQWLVKAGFLRMPYSDEFGDAHWNQVWASLEQYAHVNGHFNIPPHLEVYCEDGNAVRLASWLRKQREAKAKGLLRKDREELIQKYVDIGILSWDSSHSSTTDDEKWERMLCALRSYAEEFGNCNISSCQEYPLQDGTIVKLGAWLSQQRHHKKKNKLRADREAKLQALVDEGKLQWGMRFC